MGLYMICTLWNNVDNESTYGTYQSQTLKINKSEILFMNTFVTLLFSIPFIQDPWLNTSEMLFMNTFKENQGK